MTVASALDASSNSLDAQALEPQAEDLALRPGKFAQQALELVPDLGGVLGRRLTAEQPLRSVRVRLVNSILRKGFRFWAV